MAHRYITEQARTYASNCQEEDQYKETAEFHALLHFTTNTLILSELTDITIRGNSDFRMTDETVGVMVGGILKSKISLTSLSLTHHRIMDIGMIQICRLILPSDVDITALQELDLEGNDIGSIGCAAIKECLESPECGLSSLNLSCNALTPKGGILVAEGLKTNRTLFTLVLANCDLDLTTGIAVATTLRENSHIAALVLDRPLMVSKEDELSDHMSRVLADHPSLHSLSLKYCKVSDHGVFLFSQELLTNTVLRCLNLECNSIGIKGAEALASYLMQRNQLQSLLLTSNRICDDGAIAIAAALRTNRSLEELTLRHNGIQVEGLVAIGNALRKNDVLLFLSLWGNGFEDVSCQLFHDLYATRFPYLDIKLDIETYEVDGVHYVAERAL